MTVCLAIIDAADVYTLGCDSLPLLLLTLERGGFPDLFNRHASWLRKEVE